MAEWCGEHNIEVWAYCLMPNHVHLIVLDEPYLLACRTLRRTQGGPRAAGNGAERVSLEQRLRAHQAEG